MTTALLLKTLLKKIESISLSSNKYKAFPVDEKIRYLNETIEFLLKDGDDKFKKIDKNMFFGLISNENCVKYRNLTHIFRHLTNKNNNNRKKLEDYKKIFLLNYGEIIVN